MAKPFANRARLLALVGTFALLASPALARDVTVYGGGKSKTYKTDEARSTPTVIEWGRERRTSTDRRVERFAMERKVQTILEARDSEEGRATSDAMMRIILRGNRDARRQYSRYYPYYVRSSDFYARLERAMREDAAGVKVYRQSILDDVSSEDLQRVAKAMNALK
ncbi:MAG: hypothetical protein AAFO74_10770 [Pseudomonadota bacterium]